MKSPEGRMLFKFLLMAVVAVAPLKRPNSSKSSSSSSSSSIWLASGQGLSVSPDNLGAGAEATANEFEQFESALELATTGGRGRCSLAIACCSSVCSRSYGCSTQGPLEHPAGGTAAPFFYLTLLYNPLQAAVEVSCHMCSTKSSLTAW
jgi:hypothetical protein